MYKCVYIWGAPEAELEPCRVRGVELPACPRFFLYIYIHTYIYIYNIYIYIHIHIYTHTHTHIYIYNIYIYIYRGGGPPEAELETSRVRCVELPACPRPFLVEGVVLRDGVLEAAARVDHRDRAVALRVHLLGRAGNSNSHGARPVHLIITMIKWIQIPLRVHLHRWKGASGVEQWSVT